MKKVTKYISALALLLVIPTAHAFEQDQEYKFEDEQVFEQDGKGFTVQFLGDDKEEGVLKLFVKDTKGEYEFYDPTSDDLNRIAPAAGIQLNIEF